MTTTEQEVRRILHRRMQLARQPDHPEWDDEAVAGILAAVAAPVPSGMVTTDGPEAAAALDGLKERAEGMEALAREAVGSFTRGPNGWSARVKAATVEEWQRMLGGQP